MTSPRGHLRRIGRSFRPIVYDQDGKIFASVILRLLKIWERDQDHPIFNSDGKLAELGGAIEELAGELAEHDLVEWLNEEIKAQLRGERPEIPDLPGEEDP